MKLVRNGYPTSGWVTWAFLKRRPCKKNKIKSMIEKLLK